MKKIIFLLIVVCLFLQITESAHYKKSDANCIGAKEQQDKEASVKVQIQVDQAFPVDVRVQNDKAIPIRLQEERDKNEPLSVVILNDKAFVVDVNIKKIKHCLY